MESLSPRSSIPARAARPYGYTYFFYFRGGPLGDATRP